MGTPPGSDFGSLLRRYRLAAGLTQAELAKRARIGEDTIGALERGINRAPHQETLDRLVKVMKLSRAERATLEAAAHRKLAPVEEATPALPLPPVRAEEPGLLPSLQPSSPPPPAAPVAITPVPESQPRSTLPSDPQRSKRSRLRAGLLLGLAGLVIVGGLLGGASLLGAFRQPPPSVVHGGTWIETMRFDPFSLIPTGDPFDLPALHNALYLPLFSSDAQGVVRPAAAREVPTLQNGGISADAKTWTFRLRPGLVWSDGQPYDARDVDFSWRLWQNPAFGHTLLDIPTWSVISSAQVSADYLSITFHLQYPYMPFLALWVWSTVAPLPAHHFSQMAPKNILQSPENVNPQVVSGPFRLAESKPSDHYTLVRNPRYYRAREGLPYLDRVIFRIADRDTSLRYLQANAITSTGADMPLVPDYQRLTSYTLVAAPTDASYEGLYFNFHNIVLSSHLEVRQAMAMAIDHQALIQQAMHGFAHPLCTDHPSAVHPGYEPGASCPDFDPQAARKLLADNGWLPGPDGVRSKDGQRLEFEYSTTDSYVTFRPADQAVIQRNFKEIGIQLDIQNYLNNPFFGTFLPAGEASPPTGAIAGRFDIAEFANTYGPDPDNPIVACDQFPPKGGNFTFYCNPAIDALYQQELATVDPGARQQIFDQLHQHYLSELPFIVLFGFSAVYLVRQGTHNYQPSPFEGPTVAIAEWRCDGGHC